MSTKACHRSRFMIVCLLTLCTFIGTMFPIAAYENEINEIAAQMAENIANSGKSCVAVVDFTDLQGNVTELGRFIAEEFSVALLNVGKKFEVVDRGHLRTILKEHKLSSTGLIEPETAQKLGQIVGVEALISGSITPFGDSVRLSTKILDVNTAKMIGANSGNIPKTEAISELLGRNLSSTAETSRASSSSSNPSKVVHDEGISFKILQCKQLGNEITCEFIFTSNGENRELGMSGYYNDGSSTSRIIDEDGNEYPVKYQQMGNRSKNNGWLTNDFIADVPMKAELIFEGASTQITTAKLLEFNCSVAGKDFYVRFRDVPISK